MLLAPGNLFYYLQDRGLASPEAVIRGNFRVANLSRRNLAFHANGLVVKQPRQWQAQNIALFEAEAHWYWLATNSPVFAPLRPFFSRCLGYDSENQILMLDFPADCEDLERHFRRIASYPLETAQLLGQTLAAFHTGLTAAAIDSIKQDLTHRIPAVLSWHDIDEAAFDAAEGALEVTRIVKDDAFFREAFTRLRDSWRPETLINGDMKFAHCIARNPSEPRARASGWSADAMYFVDWECGDFGDPCWDTGAILQEFLRAWLRSIPPGPVDALEDRTARAILPIEQLQPAIQAFWQSYVKRAGFSEAEAAVKLRRSVGYAAAWLVQAAYQDLRDAPAITARAVSMLQLSRNILSAPEPAARQLLGL
jgi:hypothetical protein